MMKNKKASKLLKNRNWKARFSNRLRGKAEEVYRDYMNGLIERDVLVGKVSRNRGS